MAGSGASTSQLKPPIMDLSKCVAQSLRFVLLAALFSLLPAAVAQSARTWVSGVGDDINPGSRTAPCKTFVGALSKTAPDGKISVLDPGGFGSVTITKGITIDGSGRMASTLAAGTPCITVNAGSAAVVLRNLNLNGGTFGLRIVSAGTVRVENCTIFNSTTNGIDFESTTINSTLYIKDCHIHSSGGAALFSNPASGKVIAENSIFEQCNAGVNVVAGLVQLQKCTVTGNTGPGLAISGMGQILSSHDNVIFNNNPDGNDTSGTPLK